MEGFLSVVKNYAPVTLLVFVLAGQSVALAFLYFDLQDLKRTADFSATNPLPSYLIPPPSPKTPGSRRDQTPTDKLFFSSPEGSKSGALTNTAVCNCPPGPVGPQGEKGEKGDQGDPGTRTNADGRWVLYCQSRLGPVRQKPSYGCDTGNANADYKESDLQLWVK